MVGVEGERAVHVVGAVLVARGDAHVETEEEAQPGQVDADAQQLAEGL